MKASFNVFGSLNSENAINHLAGGHHLKNLKHFLWQYGGKMDQLDKYRILETDLTKVRLLDCSNKSLEG